MYNQFFSSLGREDKKQYLSQIQEKLVERRAFGATTCQAIEQMPDLEPGSSFSDEPFDLSDIQEAYLVGRLIENKAGRVGCHSYLEIEVDKPDVETLNIAWNRLVQHHLMLRTVIMAHGKQKPLKSIPHYEFAMHDLTHETASGVQAHLERMRHRMSHKVYPPDKWPFFEIALSMTPQSQAIIHFSIDMMIADAASLQLLMRQWFQLYRQPDVELAPPSITFKDYIKTKKVLEQSDRFKTDMSYWVKRLENMPVKPALNALLRHDSANGSLQSRRRRLSYKLKPQQCIQLDKRAQQLNITPTALLLTLFAQVLQQGSEKERFAVIVTYFNRPPLHAQIDLIVGPFISTSIFLIEWEPDLTMQEKASCLQRQLWNDLDHMSVSGIQVLRRLKAMGMVKADAVIPVVFTSVMGTSGSEDDGRPEEKEKFGGLSNNVIYSVSQTPQVLLDHQIIREQECLHLSWDVAVDHFETDAVESLFRTYCGLIETGLKETAFWHGTAFAHIGQMAGDSGASPGSRLPSACNRRVLASEISLAPDPASQYEPFPLTDQQSAYLFGRTSMGSAGNFSCQTYQEFDIAHLDLKRLHYAINTLIEVHDMLRCVFSADGYQRIIDKYEAYNVKVHDLRSWSDDQTEAHLDLLRRQMSSELRPLDQWPLFDFQVTHIDRHTSRLHIVIDLLIMDGNSIQLFFQQLFTLYTTGSGAVKTPAIRFRDYIMALDRFRKTPAYRNALDYWEQKFDRIAPAPVLKCSKEIPPAAALTRLRLESRLKGWLKLKQKAEQLGVPPAMVLLTAYGEVLAHFTHGNAFSLVVANWDRLPLHADIDSVLGDFTAMSWVSFTPASKPFADKVVAVHAANEEDLAQLPVSGLQALRKQAFKKNSGVRDGFPVVFTNFLSHSDDSLPDTFKAIFGLSHTPQVYLDNMAIDQNDHLLFSWDVLKEKFDLAQMYNMFDCYCRLLEQLAADPETWNQTDFASLFTTKPVSADDEEKLFKKMKTFNNTETALPTGRCLHAYIEDQVACMPEQTAIIFDDRTKTYTQFNAIANKWARQLKRLGSGPDRIVAVMMQRSFEMVIALHAVLKAGSAYLPIDPDYPEERIAFMLKDADVEIILTQERYRTRCAQWGKMVLCLDADTSFIKHESPENLAASAQPDHLAYVIYTSGSTGKPKGCMISHRAICNRLFWMQATYQLDSTDRVLQKTPFTFDVSVWEFFWPFLAGATLVIAKPDGHQDSRYLVDVIRRQAITVLHFVPSMLSFFINEKAAARCTSLKKIFTSGEALPYPLMEKTLSTFDAELHNLYGPTEAAVDVSCWHCQRRPDRIVPIGMPVANTQLYILSQDLKPLPLGETGELFIGGVQLARGYLNRPELTRERFIDNPFEPGTRLYRTGDRARYLPDGNIDFLGRLDSQVKLRGLRIELGEIEHQLLLHESIAEAAVLVQDQHADDPKLAAYIVSNQTPPPESKTIRQFLKAQLPPYMIPNYIAYIDNLPTTFHGKLDRKALPWPIEPSVRQTKALRPMEEHGVMAAPKAIQAAQSSENNVLREKTPEQVIADLTAIFKKVLKIETIEPTDDIFDHGATSLTLLNAIQKIGETYDMSALEIGAFMEKPCIESLALHIQVNQQTNACHSSVCDADINADQEDTTPPEIFRYEDKPHDSSADRIEMLKTPGEEIVVDLHSINFPQACYQQRRCRRSFMRRSLPAERFGKFLSLLKVLSGKGKAHQKYLYPSAGGKNAVQTYIYLKAWAVEGLAEGIYYYHPEQHCLNLVNDRPHITADVQLPQNRNIFDQSSFSIFFIAQKAAIEPIYLDFTPYLITLDTGYMAQLLSSRQSEYGIGLCPVGGLDFDEISSQFMLDESHVFLHCLLGGFPNENTERGEDNDPGLDLAALQRTDAATLNRYFKELQPYGGKSKIKETNQKGEYTYMSRREMIAFARQKLNLRRFSDQNAACPLTSAAFEPDRYKVRAAKREYTDNPIKGDQLGRFLSLLRPKRFNNRNHYLYPSFGALYEISVYLYIENDAVRNLREGLYRYDPIKHRLVLMTSRLSNALKGCHSPFNQKYYKESRFSLFLIADLGSSEATIGETALHYALLEAGCIGQLLMDHQAESGLGICPIGGLNFDRIRHDFRLSPNQLLVHSFIGGDIDYQDVNTRINAFDTQDTELRDIEAFAVDRPAETSVDIAIIGLAGSYPGASNLVKLWEMLKNGTTSIGEMPADRWNNSDYYDPDRTKLKTYTKWGGFLDGIERFDSLLFNISPVEAVCLDPQERLCLECVWHCLESSGYTADTLNRQVNKVGVFIGVMWSDYQNTGSDAWRGGGHHLATSFHSSIANRISHFFNFNGPSLAVDTSCSSAATAIHLACESIKRGECGAAVVAGVNVIGHPYHKHLLCRLNLLSADKRCRSFSADGDGWVVGEGVGTVLIRPRQQAEHYKDSVMGVIKGTAISHSGRTARYGAPSVQAQIESISSVIKKAGITEDSIDYVETAAPGSLIADSTEIEALQKVLGEERADQKTILIGSVKPNIGHLESASIMSQLTKVLLQFEHGQIAPTLYSSPLNPLIKIENTCFQIVDRLHQWKRNGNSAKNGSMRVLINAFGATGSSGHLIVEAYPAPEASEPMKSHAQESEELIVLSAADNATLRKCASNLHRHLTIEMHGRRPELRAIARTLQIGRYPLEERLAIVASGVDVLTEKLQRWLDGEKNDGDIHCARATASAGKMFEQDSGGDCRKVDWRALAAQWVKGAIVNWEAYRSNKGHKARLPLYPFAESHHRIDEKNKQIPKPSASPENEPAVKDRAALADPVTQQTENYLKGLFAHVSDIPIGMLESQKELARYGLNSLMIEQLNSRLEEDLGVNSATLFFEYPTMAGLARYLAARHRDRLIDMLNLPAAEDDRTLQRRKQTLAAEPVVDRQMENPAASGDKEDTDTDIAIIGLSGRYPQAADVETFWQNLVAGKDCVVEIPETRWDHTRFYNPDRQRPGSVYTKWGGFIDGVDEFDPTFFHISPVEAKIMDPQERLFLEIAWETLEDAGYNKNALARLFDNQVGVYVGVMHSEYHLYAAQSDSADPPVALSSGFGSIANRVSYTLGFHGPSMAVDTMCSSSFTALHLAVESLKRRECRAALVGGVNLSLHPSKYIMQCQINMSSSDGRCRSFGNGGDGFVPGEGVGAVFIKPLQAAVRDKDHILGVIKATAVNHGGGTSNYTVPNPKLQQQLISDTLAKAGIDPRTISYLEAHGTGTALGDPIEIAGLTKAYSAYTNDRQFCSIGSVKSNIGHLEGAAGIAGLTKVLLQMKHQTLVPSLHAQETNPNIDFSETPFRVQQKVQDWAIPVREQNGKRIHHPRRAGISAFGAGGANVHVIVEEYTPSQDVPSIPDVRPRQQKPQLVLLSAQTPERLKAYASRLLGFLQKHNRQVVHPDLCLETVTDALVHLAADILKVAPGDLDPTEPLEILGFDHYRFVCLSKRINTRFPAMDSGFAYDQQITLQALADGLLDRCASDTPDGPQGLNSNALDLEEIAYTLQVGREPMPSRLATIVNRVDELIDKLTHFLNDARTIPRTYIAQSNFGGDIAAILTDGMEGQQFCHALMENKNYDKVARLWTMGMNFDWQMLYEGYIPRRISLPTYPFARKRFWFEPVPCTERAKTVESKLSAENRRDISEIRVTRTPPDPGDLQKQIKAILADLLHLGPEEITGSRNLRDYGMDSVVFMRLCNAIQMDGYKLKTEDFHQTATLNDLVIRLMAQSQQSVSGAAREGPTAAACMAPGLPAVQTAPPPVGVVSEAERSNVSFALAFEQQRYYDLEQVRDINANLVIPFGFHLKGELNENALEQSIRMIVARHRSLRVVFNQKRTRVMQTVVTDPSFQIEIHDLQHLDESEEKVLQIMHKALHDRFDLTQFPLFRVILLKLAEDEHLLVFNLHHVIFDAASIFLFSNELFSGYLALKHNERLKLSPLQEQYDSYVVWEKDQLDSALAQRRAYWHKLFREKAFGLNLPYDKHDPPDVAPTADPETATLDEKTVKKVHEVAKRLQITPYHVYLGALAATLYGYTENPNLLIGTPLTNRKFKAAETMIGLLANLSVTVVDVDDKTVFEELLKRTATAAGDADRYQLPYQMLLNLLQQERTDPDYMPIQVAMNYFSLHQPMVAVEDMKVTYMDIIRSGRGFDLFLSVFHSADRDSVRLEYAANRFSLEKVRAILRDYQKTLNYILDNLQHTFQHLFDEKSLGFQPHYSVCIASTFSDQPLNDPLQFWSTQLERPLNVTFAPYNQVFQELLQSDSLLASNHNGLNVLLIRLEDWCGADPQLDRQILSTKDNLAKFSQLIIQSVRERPTTPYVIGICPDSPRRLQQEVWKSAAAQMLVRLEATFEPLKTVHLLKPPEIIGLFDIQSCYDESRNRLGHIPYTDDFYTSLAMLIARRCYHCFTPYMKAVVLDCDNTLWKGVIGEDGLDGIKIDDGHLLLQERMLQLQQNGMLLCLCSKNTAEDVWAVFQNRPEMLLKPQHITAAQINWNPKPENIRILARQLNLGMDSFIFIDDNPLEIEQVRTQCPEVVSLQFPQTSVEAARFLRHSWVLEKQASSEEDRKRTELYKHNFAREQLLAASDSFKSFIDSLNMEIEIRAMHQDERTRVSQLTFRTNQFNATTIRRNEKQVESLVNDGEHHCIIVKAKDRFGDYGLVGVVIYSVVEQLQLVVDTFLLSCRVLCKGVEHAVAAELGRIAAKEKCSAVHIPLKHTARNRPMRDFLDATVSDFKDIRGNDIVYIIPVDAMKAIRFQTNAAPLKTNTGKKPDLDKYAAAPATGNRSHWHSALWETCGLLENLRRQTQVRQVDRPLNNLSEYTPPKTETEKKLAQVWNQVMKTKRVGLDWNLFDLGPDSLSVVRFLSDTSNAFNMAINHSHIIQYPTLAELAGHVDQCLSELGGK